jgi:hypothetical protein
MLFSNGVALYEKLAWGIQDGSAADDISYTSGVDGSGNVFASGSTTGSLYAAHAGGQDIWICKRSGSDGNELWAVQYGTAGDEYGYALAVDTNGDVFVTGSTSGALNAGSAGSFDIFVSKHSGTDGSKIWGVQIGGGASDNARGIGVDSSGNVLVAGYTKGCLYPGSNCTGYDYFYDFFLVKLDGSDGSEIWGTLFGLTFLQSWHLSLALDSSDNVFVASNSYWDVYAVNAGGSDAWVSKRSGSDGSEIWGKQYGTEDDEAFQCMAVDNSGDVLLGGWSDGSLFGPTSGTYDIFGLKLDGSDGSEIWGVQYGTSFIDVPSGLALDSSGDVFIAGYTDGSLYATNAGSHDIWASKRSGSDGSELWAVQYGTAAGDIDRGLSVDATGDVFLTGYTEGSLHGTITAEAFTDIFVSKYSLSTDPFPTAKPTVFVSTTTPAPSTNSTPSVSVSGSNTDNMMLTIIIALVVAVMIIGGVGAYFIIARVALKRKSEEPPGVAPANNYIPVSSSPNNSSRVASVSPVGGDAHVGLHLQEAAHQQIQTSASDHATALTFPEIAMTQLHVAPYTHQESFVTQDKLRELCGGNYSQTLYDTYKNDQGMFPLNKLKELSQATDVFLTHNWGTGNATHDRVARINLALKKKKLTTWFDSDRMRGNIVEQMTSGIEKSGLVIVFITKEYIEKVNGSNSTDNCKIEFEYAVRRKKREKIISVLLDSDCWDTKDWRGIFGAALGGQLYVNMSDDAKFDDSMQELCNMIRAHQGDK